MTKDTQPKSNKKEIITRSAKAREDKKRNIKKSNKINKISENDIDLEEANIVLDVEELEDPSILKEVDLSCTLDNTLETLQLKKPNQVYYEIYQKAKEKAKEAKKNAILAYIEMKNIKKTYKIIEDN